MIKPSSCNSFILQWISDCLTLSLLHILVAVDAVVTGTGGVDFAAAASKFGTVVGRSTSPNVVTKVNRVGHSAD